MSDDDDRGESRRTAARRAVRQSGDRSARLAQTLMGLHASQLSKLELDEDLREVVDRARATTSNIARRREERSLAGALRRVDLAELTAKLLNVQSTGVAEPQLFKAAETWRGRLIEDPATAAAFHAKFPGGDPAKLTKLIDDARRERDTGKPPGAARLLFRYVLATMKGPGEASESAKG